MDKHHSLYTWMKAMNILLLIRELKNVFNNIIRLYKENVTKISNTLVKWRVIKSVNYWTRITHFLWWPSIGQSKYPMSRETNNFNTQSLGKPGTGSIVSQGQVHCYLQSAWSHYFKCIKSGPMSPAFCLPTQFTII